ncbi:MAG TPA: biopolymer transporter ExbD [Pyrinomonadaceae bacterium]|nr:biopolymer transporter ExbD [Pyrinomonadaceae bacterium]
MTKPQINVTPLIDVLLVLLIIFMVITPMKPSSFEARVPSEPDDARIVEPDPQTLVVTVGSDSSLRLNNDDLSASVDDAAKLIDKLSAVFAERERNFAFRDPQPGDAGPQVERTVFIKAPRGLSYGSVAKVVDAVKGGGARPISLQIDGLE